MDSTSGQLLINIPNHAIYVSWDHLTSATQIAKYEVRRADNFIATTWETIGTVDWPSNEFIDETGHPSYYYKIVALDSGDPAVELVSSQPFIGEECLIKASLGYQISDLLNIPIHDEEAIFARGRTSASFAFSNWNYWPRPEIRISGTSDGTVDPYIILDEIESTLQTQSGIQNYADGLRYKLDYQGRIYFLQDDNTTAASVQSYDSIFGSYNVRLFTGNEMNNALNIALQSINCVPGTTKYQSVSVAPYYYDPALIAGATYFLLRGLLTRLNQRETRLLIQDPDNESFNAIDNIKENIKLYKEDFDNLLKTIGKMKYPKTYAIITPEHMMPGGRSRFFRYAWKGEG